MHTNQDLSLPIGTPILAIGYTAARPFNSITFWTAAPPIVLAGRISAEPYNGGCTLFLANGPMADVIGGRGFKPVSVDRPQLQMLAFRYPNFAGERDAYLYVAMRDTCGVVEEIEKNGLKWPQHLQYTTKIADHILTAFHYLDTLAQSHLLSAFG